MFIVTLLFANMYLNLCVRNQICKSLSLQMCPHLKIHVHVSTHLALSFENEVNVTELWMNG